jgi:hypothetical protein
MRPCQNWKAQEMVMKFIYCTNNVYKEFVCKTCQAKLNSVDMYNLKYEVMISDLSKLWLITWFKTSSVSQSKNLTLVVW